MDCASAEIRSTYGEIPTQALSAYFNVMCPGLGGFEYYMDPCGYDLRVSAIDSFGELIDIIEQADLSCDETKAGFQIHIYLLPELNQVT